MSVLLPVLVYAVPLLLILGGYVWVVKRNEAKNKALLQESINAGLTEPASLHPLIDVTRCIGCAACVTACPEKEVLGIINGRAQLVGPTNCIGHGACQQACPVGAIQLVFGTETRGVDIPSVSPEFETSVPGIYIAGELGGMGLIRNAITQGRQAMAQMVKQLKRDVHCEYDVVIVGAGPAGIAASLAAKAEGIRYKTLDQEQSLGGTVAHFPRGKLVMTHPVDLPLAGKTKFRESSKEALLAFWQGIIMRFPLDIDFGQKVEQILPLGEGFEVVTQGQRYQAQKVLLAIGRRGSPRRLDIPGEELAKVVYRLVDPEQYRGQRVMVVGGGDSALEAAAALAEHSIAAVTTLVYRGESFNRAKARNRLLIEKLASDGKLDIKLRHQPLSIAEQCVTLSDQGTSRLCEVPNDVVIVCAGGELPTTFLKRTGIQVETKHGTA
jgi:thioredoxin reductase (NADPH)